MGEHRAEEDERCGAEAEHPPLPNGTDDEFSAPVILHLRNTVAGHNDQAGQRQKEDHPPVSGAELGGPVDGVVEGGAHHAGDAAHQTGKQQPFQKGRRVGADSGQVVFQFVLHGILPRVLILSLNFNHTAERGTGQSFAA